MEYKNFELDFVERTLSNLEWIEKRNSINKENPTAKTFYEFTNLINQCLGLILLPSQFSNSTFLANFSQELTHYGVGNNIVNKIKGNKDKTLSNILRHLRNGIAHGHIQQYSVNNHDITDVRILDADKGVVITSDDDAHTIIEFNIEELRTFAIKVAEEYCRLKKEELDQAIN
jgi:hypothetical protein